MTNSGTLTPQSGDGFAWTDVDYYLATWQAASRGEEGKRGGGNLELELERKSLRHARCDPRRISGAKIRGKGKFPSATHSLTLRVFSSPKVRTVCDCDSKA
jgi:hypothetical protein